MFEAIPPEIAALLWPEDERHWIERDGKWRERAQYWAAMHTQELIRELLREICDLRARLDERVMANAR